MANLSVSKATVSVYFTCALEMLPQPQTNVHEASWSREKTACKVGMKQNI